MTYQKQLKIHLAEYKITRLGIEAPGVFRYRGRNVERAHILPLQNADLNLLDHARPIIQAFLSKHPGVKPHRFSHHLNSSQTFAFNLFFPYFEGGSVAATSLLRALGMGAALSAWEPEAIPDANEGTNIDVLWGTTDGIETLCEVKLSESSFGKAEANQRRLEKYRNIYLPVLQDHLKPQFLTLDIFLNAYQFMRNVWHLALSDQAQLIFLLPRANITLWAKLKVLIEGVLPTTSQRIRAVAIEDVLAALIGDTHLSLQLREYARELSMKYVIPDLPRRTIYSNRTETAYDALAKKP